MVIQRWQSVYLLIAAIMMGLFIFFPTFQFSTVNGVYDFSPMGITMQGTPDTQSSGINSALGTPIYIWGVMILSVLIFLFIFISIFKFKTPTLQRKMTWVSIVLTISLYVSIGAYSISIFEALGMETWSLCTASMLPPLAVIFLGLAIRGINSDLRKLSYSNRIR